MIYSDNNNSQNYPDNVLEALENVEQLKLAGKHEESIKEATKLLVDDPDCVAALEELADNYVSLNDFSKAKKASERALLLYNDSYTAHYILGFIASSQQAWSVASKELTVANNLRSNNPEILRCLGWALFNNEQRTKGIVVLERALNIDPENSLTLCDLGICYLQTKNFEKSTELLRKACELDPNNKRARECYDAAINFSERFGSNVTINHKNSKNKTPYRKSFI